MNALKVGIIGLFVLLPFLFIQGVQTQQEYYKIKYQQRLERASESSLRDGLFALKTFSRFSYDEEEMKRIEVAEEATRETMLRSFAFAMNAQTEGEVERWQERVALIGFVTYDALILYDVSRKERLELPFYQRMEEADGVLYTRRDLLAENKKQSGKREIMIAPLLEKVLSGYVPNAETLLPEHSSSILGKDLREVGVFLLVRGDAVQENQGKMILKLGKAALSEREN